ncbi:MAG: nucleotidyl transferase AbiEii/AbiGii toxin family protein [Deltaproteobacteria bacterium]|nr:nucleotidyl transferase AbiEii/AbiGii toxin family protein [Deltaproteobacteria bacterium]
MITKAYITRLASRQGVPAKTVERDYALAHIVAAIASQSEASKLVFKGGTALRLCHFEDYRYSADLDFSIMGGSTEDALDTIAQGLCTVGGSLNGIRLTKDNPPRIAYSGPLGRERTIKLDLADDELVFDTEHRRLLPRWSDLPRDTSVHVYTLLEITAEKLRCVLQRLQCRDFFDLHLLFEEVTVEPAEAASVFRLKARHRGFDPESFAKRYAERTEQYRKRWEMELGEHLSGELPHFNEVERRVARHLRRAGLL